MKAGVHIAASVNVATRMHLDDKNNRPPEERIGGDPCREAG